MGRRRNLALLSRPVTNARKTAETVAVELAYYRRSLDQRSLAVDVEGVVVAACAAVAIAVVAVNAADAAEAVDSYRQDFC